MKKLDLAYSTDEEVFNSSGEFNCYEDAVLEAILEKDAEVGDTIFVGEKTKHMPHICAENVIEDLSEQAYDECGEHAQDYLTEVKDSERLELENELNDVLQKWMDRFKHHPYFYLVKKVKRFEVTQELIDKALGEEKRI